MSEILKKLINDDYKILNVYKVAKAGNGGHIYFKTDAYELIKDMRVYLVKKDNVVKMIVEE